MIKKLFSILICFFLLTGKLYAIENNSLSIGNQNSKIIIKVFSSLTCPHCANFHKKIFDDLKKEYIDKNKVRFEHHSFPLDLAALNAEKLLRCVESKEKSFKLLSEVYESQNQWAVGSDINKINESIKKIGISFEIDPEKIDKCLGDEKAQDIILNERIAAQKNYKITSTPTIYINEKQYSGKHEFKEFKKALEKLL
jgi:protein-disulfide isomerase